MIVLPRGRTEGDVDAILIDEALKVAHLDRAPDGSHGAMHVLDPMQNDDVGLRPGSRLEALVDGVVVTIDVEDNASLNEEPRGRAEWPVGGRRRAANR